VVLLITSNVNGHFVSYFNLIDSHCDVPVELLHVDNSSFFKSIIEIIVFIVKRFSDVDTVVVLNGDRDIFWCIVLAIVFWTKRIKSIVYYTFQCDKQSFLHLLKKMFFYLSSRFGVELLFLEYEPKGFERFFLGKRAKKIYDPFLLAPSFRKTESNETTYLIAGYVDERKCVQESIEALQILSKKEPSIKRRLVILGRQSDAVKKYLSGLVVEEVNFVVDMYSERFSDSTLSDMICNSDIVLAIYKMHYGSSGIVINSICFNKKVLFIPVGVLKDFAEELGLEHLPQTNDVNSICDSMEYIEDKSIQYTSAARELFVKRREPDLFAAEILG
jgi:hypothetical protein